MEAIPRVIRVMSRGAGGDRAATVLCGAQSPPRRFALDAALIMFDASAEGQTEQEPQ